MGGEIAGAVGRMRISRGVPLHLPRQCADDATWARLDHWGVRGSGKGKWIPYLYGST